MKSLPKSPKSYPSLSRRPNGREAEADLMVKLLVDIIANKSYFAKSFGKHTKKDSQRFHSGRKPVV